MGIRNDAKTFVDAIDVKLAQVYNFVAPPGKETEVTALKAEVYDTISRKSRELSKKVRAIASDKTPAELEVEAQAILDREFQGDEE